AAPPRGGGEAPRPRRHPRQGRPAPRDRPDPHRVRRRPRPPPPPRRGLAARRGYRREDQGPGAPAVVRGQLPLRHPRPGDVPALGRSRRALCALPLLPRRQQLQLVVRQERQARRDAGPGAARVRPRQAPGDLPRHREARPRRRADRAPRRRPVGVGVPRQRPGPPVPLQPLPGAERRRPAPLAPAEGIGGAMLIWAARRLLAVVPVLFGVTLAVFSMLFLVPGDPVKMMLAEFVTNPDQVAQMRAQLHLDDPIPVQYGRFVGNAMRGDLGTSIRSRRPVTAEIAENVGSTGLLALASMAVAVALGVPL